MRLLLLTLLSVSALMTGCCHNYRHGFQRNAYSSCVGCDASYAMPAPVRADDYQTRKMRRWYRQLNHEPRQRSRHSSAYGMYNDYDVYNDVVCDCGDDVMWSSDAYSGEMYSGEIYSEGTMPGTEYSPQPQNITPQPAPPVEQEYLAPEPRKFEAPQEEEAPDMARQPQPTPAPLPQAAGEPTELMMYQLPQ